MDLSNFGVVDKIQQKKERMVKYNQYVEELKSKGIESAEYKADLIFNKSDAFVSNKKEKKEFNQEISTHLTNEELEILSKYTNINHYVKTNFKKAILVEMLRLLEEGKLSFKNDKMDVVIKDGI